MDVGLAKGLIPRLPHHCSSLSLKGVDLTGPHLEVVQGKPDQVFRPCRLALPILKLNL